MNRLLPLLFLLLLASCGPPPPPDYLQEWNAVEQSRSRIWNNIRKGDPREVVKHWREMKDVLATIPDSADKLDWEHRFRQTLKHDLELYWDEFRLGSRRALLTEEFAAIAKESGSTRVQRDLQEYHAALQKLSPNGDLDALARQRQIGVLLVTMAPDRSDRDLNYDVTLGGGDTETGRNIARTLIKGLSPLAPGWLTLVENPANLADFAHQMVVVVCIQEKAFGPLGDMKVPERLDAMVVMPPGLGGAQRLITHSGRAKLPESIITELDKRQMTNEKHQLVADFFATLGSIPALNINTKTEAPTGQPLLVSVDGCAAWHKSLLLPALASQFPGRVPQLSSQQSELTVTIAMEAAHTGVGTLHYHNACTMTLTGTQNSDASLPAAISSDLPLPDDIGLGTLLVYKEAGQYALLFDVIHKLHKAKASVEDLEQPQK